MAEWRARQPADLLRRLGFDDGHAPCQTTLHRLFAKLDARAVARALRTCFDAPDDRERGAQGVAIDGKAQHGRRQFETDPSVVQVLTAFCAEQSHPHAGTRLTEEPIEQAADKAEAELTVAPRVIEQVDWQGRVLTAGTRLRVSLYCQRSLCQQVLDRGGDYLLTVKANQRTLYQALLRTFDPQARPLLDRREVRTIDKGTPASGYPRIEVRHLVATADPLALPDWPGVAQLIRIERTWWEQGNRKQQVRYGITSLPPTIGTARRLLDLKRQHWLIENRSHRAYSDDGGNTWTSQTVFSDPGCAASTSPQSTFPNACQDLSELFNALAVDDAGNVYVAFAWRDPTQAHPEYDIYVEKGAPQTNGSISFSRPNRVNTDTGTHYMPWLAAGQSGAIDVVFYDTSYVEGTAAFNKPAAAPGSAVWNVDMAQSFNGGQTFTQSLVSDHPASFGDICTVGIFCGPQGTALGWGQDRILFDDFGIAIGPDGAARVAWTDARDSWSSTCNPNVSPNDDSDVSCQTTYLYFACQSGGVGLYGQKIKGCPVAVKPR